MSGRENGTGNGNGRDEKPLPGAAGQRDDRAGQEAAPFDAFFDLAAVCLRLM